LHPVKGYVVVVVVVKLHPVMQLNFFAYLSMINRNNCFDPFVESRAESIASAPILSLLVHGYLFNFTML
jgi:hypothetical protein